MGSDYAVVYASVVSVDYWELLGAELMVAVIEQKQKTTNPLHTTLQRERTFTEGKKSKLAAVGPRAPSLMRNQPI